MKIKRTRMLPLYPWRCFEAECEREDGSKAYVNIGLPLKDGKKLDYLYEDNWWSYRKPLTEIDFENPDKDYVWDEECEEIAYKLVNAWNANPVYRETENAWEKGAWNE